MGSSVTQFRSTQLQLFAGLRGSQDPGSHGLDDGARLLNQLRIAGIHALAQIQIVLEPDAHIAAEKHRLRHPGHLHAADREGAPIAVLGQRIDHGEQMAHVGRNSVGNAHAQLNERRGGQESFLDHLPDEPEVARIEDFQLRLNAEILGNGGALAQIIGGGHVGAVAVAEIQGPAVQGGDVRPVEAFVAQVDDVAHAVFLADEVAAGARRVLQAMIPHHDIAAHAAGEVHDHIDLALANALDDFAVVLGLHAEGAGFGFAHVDVDDGRSGLGSRDGGGGDLFRGDGAVRALGDLGVIAGDGAGNDDVVIHEASPKSEIGVPKDKCGYIIVMIIFKWRYRNGWMYRNSGFQALGARGTYLAPASAWMISASPQTPRMRPFSASSTGWPVAWRRRMMDCRDREAETTATPGSRRARSASS